MPCTSSVDAWTGGGEALSWEFAKTENKATIKARAHLLLFKARFAAQGYRILSPAGIVIEYGPAVPEPDAGYTIAKKGFLIDATNSETVQGDFESANFIG